MDNITEPLTLQEALSHETWLSHKLGDLYTMKGDNDKWKIAYYPLLGTYKGGKWIEFEEPRALVEKPMLNKGIDLREIPISFLVKTT
jgi:hypothetical protein